jgi:hypothetical protein
MSTLSSLPTDVILALSLYLPLPSVVSFLMTSKDMQSTIYRSQYLWKILADRVWRDKVYVNEYMRIIADGSKSEDAHRNSVCAKIKSDNSIKELRVSCVKAGATGAQIAGCFEKSELVTLLYETKFEHAFGFLRRFKEARFTNNVPLQPPAMIALRMTLEDNNRQYLTDAEIHSLTFHVRIRADGQFMQLAPVDPWHLGKGVTKVKLHANGSVEWLWAVHNGETMNPFSYMMDDDSMQNMTWSLVQSGTGCHLKINEQNGPVERIVRHSSNGGWIMYSGATIWTSWETFNYEDDWEVSEENLR